MINLPKKTLGNETSQHCDDGFTIRNYQRRLKCFFKLFVDARI